jgi:septum formation protein
MVDVDETPLPGEPGAEYVRRVAREKAEKGEEIMLMRHLPPRPVLAADTTVLLDGHILGKPNNRSEAINILKQLSGRAHEVHTALALMSGGRLSQSVSISTVRFRPLSIDDIERYCDTGEPYDKAGAYGIQGLAGVFIEHLSGSHSGVMGLPMYETAQLLGRAGILIP